MARTPTQAWWVGLQARLLGVDCTLVGLGCSWSLHAGYCTLVGLRCSCMQLFKCVFVQPDVQMPARLCRVLHVCRCLV